MPTPCVTCAHPDREAIDRALVLGAESLRSLARQYGMDRQSLARHRDAHLSAALVKIQTEREEAGPRSALDRYERLAAALEAAIYSGETLPAALVRELRGCLDSIAKIRGELSEAPQVTVNVIESPEFLHRMAQLRQALQSYPQALAAVLDMWRSAAPAADPPPSETGAIAVGCSGPVQPAPRGVS